MTGESIHYKNILVYRLVSYVKYTSKKLLTIELNHIPKVQYAWDKAELYKKW